MLTRRGFAGVAGCAIDSLAGFSATEAFGQASPPTTADGVASNDQIDNSIADAGSWRVNRYDGNRSAGLVGWL
jgi:hypothetical protein